MADVLDRTSPVNPAWPRVRGDAISWVRWGCPHCDAVVEIITEISGLLIWQNGFGRAPFVTAEIGASVESLDAEMQQHIAKEHPDKKDTEIGRS